jgi:hypothetical protein
MKYINVLHTEAGYSQFHPGEGAVRPLLERFSPLISRKSRNPFKKAI